MPSPTNVRDIIGRASRRSLSPKRWSRLVRDRLSKEGFQSDEAERVVSNGLVYHLVRPGSPTILVNYLNHALGSGLLTARTFALSLLAYLHRSDAATPIATPLLAAISAALLNNPTGLGPVDALPSPISIWPDIPDIGTSNSAAVSPEEIPALVLLLPLVRNCAINGVPAPIVALSARLTSLLPALPAPPFEAGLEAAQLSAVIPEDVSKPLRECLTGLMADLPLPVAMPAPDGTMFGSQILGVGQGSNYGDMGASLSGLSSLQSTPIPLRQAAEFLIEYSCRSRSWARNDAYGSNPPTPPPHHIHVIRLGRALTNDSQAFLGALLDASCALVLSRWSHGPTAAVRPWVFFTDELPVLLRWWRDHADANWPFPPNLQDALSQVFSSQGPQIANWFQAVTSMYNAKCSQMEAEDESSAYSQPDGWSMMSLESTAVRRYVSLGLLDDDATVALIGTSVKSPPPAGESLIERLATAPQSHLPALEFFITYAAGTPRELGAEIVQCISSLPITHPPEQLFERLAGSPSILALITAFITPTTLLDLLTAHILSRVDGNLSEDPQASLIRFGSGVMLIEVVCAQFDLPLPDLLYDSRRALTLGDLPAGGHDNLDRWVKALFGSDGIDDEILLATSPQDVCRTSTTLVRQAVIATMNAQIDLDTLHSGLSYFAQPLLSWCLGGVVGWLCHEIERLGLLAGVLLNVLHTLVLDSSFPEPLLRANSRTIQQLLEPGMGLEAVLKSSKFDVVAVRSRLQAVGGPDGSTLLPEMASQPTLQALRYELLAVRTMDLTSEGWDTRLLDAFEGAVRTHGALRTIEGIMSDVIYPSLMDVHGERGDALIQFVSLLFSLRLPRVTALPLVVVLVDAYVPMLFGRRSPFVIQSESSTAMGLPLHSLPGQSSPPVQYAVHALHRVLRFALFAADADADARDSDQTALADTLVQHLVDELRYQRSRPVTQTQPNKRKRTRYAQESTHGAEPDLNADQRELLTSLCNTLENDEEMRSHWPALASLQT